MPRATEIFTVVIAGDNEADEPAYALAPGAFKDDQDLYDQPDRIIAVPTMVGGRQLQEGDQVCATTGIFIDRGEQARPTDFRLYGTTATRHSTERKE